MTRPPKPGVRLRLAAEEDAEALLAIYAPIVERTHISFELEPPTIEEMAGRIRDYGGFAPYLVCEEAGEILGFAYGAPFRPRPAYRFSAETSVYVGERARRRGVASALYRALLGLLERQGFVTAVAGIALPNPQSVALHEALGFERVALLPSIGFKHGEWRDVGYWSFRLREPPHAPSEPRPPSRISNPGDVLEEEARRVRIDV